MAHLSFFFPDILCTGIPLLILCAVRTSALKGMDAESVIDSFGFTQSNTNSLMRREGYEVGELPVLCPPNAKKTASGKACVCNDGYHGKLYEIGPPHRVTGAWTARTKPECQLAKCPEGAGVAPECKCLSTMAGNVSFAQTPKGKESAAWSGKCVPCPANSAQLELASGGSETCRCGEGYRAKIQLKPFKVGDELDSIRGECELAPCPQHANARVVSGVPTCTCKEGYEGDLTFDADRLIAKWQGKCSKAASI